MDVSLLIRQKLDELGKGQNDLALATGVTESYISQLLARKKSPPAPGKSEIYEKIGVYLGLPGGELSKLAAVQRQTELKRKIGETPTALHEEIRETLLTKCPEGKREEIRRIFEKDAYGELERLVRQTLLEMAGGETELEEGLTSWDLDLKTFAIHAVIGKVKKSFAYGELLDEPIEPGFEQFRRDKSMSGDVKREEMDFLRGLRFKDRQPTAIYYYRELQNLRDPLHFKEKNEV